jgi:hypothetical protein
MCSSPNAFYVPSTCSSSSYFLKSMNYEPSSPYIEVRPSAPRLKHPPARTYQQLPCQWFSCLQVKATTMVPPTDNTCNLSWVSGWPSWGTVTPSVTKLVGTNTSSPAPPTPHGSIYSIINWEAFRSDRNSSVACSSFVCTFLQGVVQCRVQTSSGAHPSSCPMATEGLSSGGKAAGAWRWPLTSI